jgi:hypothetical protein
MRGGGEAVRTGHKKAQTAQKSGINARAAARGYGARLLSRFNYHNFEAHEVTESLGKRTLKRHKCRAPREMLASANKRFIAADFMWPFSPFALSCGQSQSPSLT